MRIFEENLSSVLFRAQVHPVTGVQKVTQRLANSSSTWVFDLFDLADLSSFSLLFTIFGNVLTTWMLFVSECNPYFAGKGTFKQLTFLNKPNNWFSHKFVLFDFKLRR
jgi:hypothetical protein